MPIDRIPLTAAEKGLTRVKWVVLYYLKQVLYKNNVYGDALSLVIGKYLNGCNDTYCTDFNIHFRVMTYYSPDPILRAYTRRTCGPIEDWSTGDVTNMSYLFAYYREEQEQEEGSVKSADHIVLPIEKWDVSNVRLMRGMFQNSTFHVNIAAWDLSKVLDTTDLNKADPSLSNTKTDELLVWLSEKGGSRLLKKVCHSARYGFMRNYLAFSEKAYEPLTKTSFQIIQEMYSLVAAGDRNSVLVGLLLEQSGVYFRAKHFAKLKM